MTAHLKKMDEPQKTRCITTRYSNHLDKQIKYLVKNKSELFSKIIFSYIFNQ